MSAYRDPAGREVVEGDGLGTDPPLVEGDPFGGVDEGTVAGGVIEGLAGVGMADPDAGMMPYRPLSSRILCVPSPVMTSPWAPGLGPVRPIWRFLQLRGMHGTPHRVPLRDAISHGDLALDRAPVVDARPLTLSLATPYDRWLYSHLRGLHSRWVVRGVRVATMVVAGPPNRTPTDVPCAHWLWAKSPVIGGSHWCNRWTGRVMGPLWIWPDLSAHTRWSLTLEDWLHTYRVWYDPIVSYDSGLVLDTRMLALMGLPIPLPPAMVDQLRPVVRLLSLADLPPATLTEGHGLVSPWLPGSTVRYPQARWCALLDQFPDVPVTLPALTSLQDLPRWLQTRLTAQPSAQPPGSVPVPPDGRTVSRPITRTQSRAQRLYRQQSYWIAQSRARKALTHG